ncbi:MAG: MBOAT family O-acyltransferase [Planctomycetota bacterium]
MTFVSVTFLVFFVLFLLIYWNLAGSSRILVCLAASYLFYGWWDYRFLALILGSTVVDFLIARGIHTANSKSVKRLLLSLSVFANLGVLCFFKYFKFFIQSTEDLMAQVGWIVDWPTLNIILPIGISFYTFQTLSYTIDVYRQKIQPENDFLKFATFVAFFPQLVAGPIVRASHFLPQLQSDRTFQFSNLTSGFHQMVIGFAKKLIIADTLAVVVDPVFAFPEGHCSLDMIFAASLFSIQIYADFSGYSDIAIGAARMAGFELPLNFDRPFFAASFRDFWRRWHISLSTWLRDYLYFPLGGSRQNQWMTYRNIMITMLLAGVWHGAGLTFAVWGLMLGAYLCMEAMIGPLVSQRCRKMIGERGTQAMGSLLVFAFLTFSLIIFRNPTLVDGMAYLGGLFDPNGFSPNLLQNRIPLLKALAVSFGFFLIEASISWSFLPNTYYRQPMLRSATSLVLLWMIAFLGTFQGTAFVYFQF